MFEIVKDCELLGDPVVSRTGALCLLASVLIVATFVQRIVPSGWLRDGRR